MLDKTMLDKKMLDEKTMLVCRENNARWVRIPSGAQRLRNLSIKMLLF
jgi:hypothetical protein